MIAARDYAFAAAATPTLAAATPPICHLRRQLHNAVCEFADTPPFSYFMPFRYLRHAATPLMPLMILLCAADAMILMPLRHFRYYFAGFRQHTPDDGDIYADAHRHAAYAAFSRAAIAMLFF